MCGTATESTTHVLCACPKIAQSLYKARQDRSLRPITTIYHCLLENYNFQDSNNEKSWSQQRPQSPLVENENAKILWDILFQLQKAPENEANKIDMAEYDKQTYNWTLLEGKVCQVGTIADKTAKKQENYAELRVGIKQLYTSTSVKQINIIF